MNSSENIGVKPEKKEGRSFLREAKRALKIASLVAPLMLASMEGKADAGGSVPGGMSLDRPTAGKTINGGESHIKSHMESHIKPFSTKTLTGGADQSYINQQKNIKKENNPNMFVNGSSETVYEDDNVKVIGDKNTHYERDSRGNTKMSGGILINK